jgi:hypothetical protein
LLAKVVECGFRPDVGPLTFRWNRLRHEWRTLAVQIASP